MRRLLFIAHRVPYPPNKGERLRAFHEIKALSRRFEVTVAAIAHSAEDVEAASLLQGHCHKVLLARNRKPIALASGAVGLIQGRSVTEGYFHSRRLARQICSAAVEAGEPFDVALGYCSGMLDMLLDAPAGARVMDLVDVDSAKWGAYARMGRGAKGLLYDIEARRVSALERRSIDSCDAVVLVSEAEAETLGECVSNVHAISNGVDLDYFTPSEGHSNGSIVFTGTMDYDPNIDGVRWFAQHVWPQVRRSLPKCRFVIVGRDPTPAVRELVEIDGIDVTGEVPDVRPFLAKASVAVAPLHIARGVQNKVLEAAAAGKAIVGTEASVKGLAFRPDHDVLVANSVGHWVRCLVGLLLREEQVAELGRNARKTVEEYYSWDAQLAPLVNLCERLSQG